MAQDRFLRDHVTKNDVVVVSVGGNDIALKPALCTIVSMLLLMCCTTNNCLDNCTCGCAFPCDDYCCGCGCGCFSNCTAWPPGYGYFLHLFGTRIRTYVDNMTQKNRPKKMLISWWDSRGVMGGQCIRVVGIQSQSTGEFVNYHRFISLPTILANLIMISLPFFLFTAYWQRLQILIRNVFRDAIRNIKIPGSEVIGIPLFAAMNGKNTREYSQRVEPSSLGMHISLILVHLSFLFFIYLHLHLYSFFTLINHLFLKTYCAFNWSFII